MVVNRDGTVEQVTHYYPYGPRSHRESIFMLSARRRGFSRGKVIGDISTNESLQKYKFEGKELDRTFGLDNYDIHARSYFAMAPMWDRTDPLAEKYYGIGPYVYCGGDPVNRGDYDGMDYWSTSDPEAIHNFMMYGSYSGDKWDHLTDDEFSSNLFYNDETNKYYLSFGTVEDEEAVCYGRSFSWPPSVDYNSSSTQNENTSASLTSTISGSSKLMGIALYGSGQVTSYGEPTAKIYNISNLYTFHDLNGNMINSTRPSFYIPKFRAKTAGRIAKGLKIGGGIIGAVSVVNTLNDIQKGEEDFFGWGGLDLVMTGVGYVWPYGTIVSTVYCGYRCFSE